MSMNIEVVFPGGKKTTAKAGEPFKNVAARAGFKPTYGCKQGSCGACEIKVNGKKESGHRCALASPRCRRPTSRWWPFSWLRTASMAVLGVRVPGERSSEWQRSKGSAVK
eukprot:scaffold7362_cov266-Pinguiococcus_pyrenoidosus.AAC.7